jgi:hypothetical protein
MFARRRLLTDGGVQILAAEQSLTMSLLFKPSAILGRVSDDVSVPGTTLCSVQRRRAVSGRIRQIGDFRFRRSPSIVRQTSPPARRPASTRASIVAVWLTAGDVRRRHPETV